MRTRHRRRAWVRTALAAPLLLALQLGGTTCGCDAERCGDGALTGDEQCDDGNQAADDGCDGSCRVEPLWDCRGAPSTCVANKLSHGLSACLNGTFDGEQNPDLEHLRCHTFRALTGASMGGGAASRLATTYPELFDVVGIMGSPFTDPHAFWNMIRRTHLDGFCPRDQILDQLDRIDDPEADALQCGPVTLGDLAAPGTACAMFASSYNHWFRGPDAGRGSPFDREFLIWIVHDLMAMYGSPLLENPDHSILAPGLPEAWLPATDLTAEERGAICAHPVTVHGIYSLEHNPDGSLPLVSFCDGAEPDHGDFWPEHHRLAAGTAEAPSGRFDSGQLSPDESYQVRYNAPGTYFIHCAEHPHSEGAIRIEVRGESCDDGGLEPGDGCSATCLVEAGWRCQGSPSTCARSCGDGSLDPSETCDDANQVAGDGCDGSCQLEPGWRCAGVPSSCAATTCGDGALDADEGCDDGGLTAGDGCSPWCAVEPGFACPAAGQVCVALCGDGAIDPAERCDDGNRSDGDGCTAGCLVEPGFSCAGTPSQCQVSCGDGAIAPSERCDDGNRSDGDGCGGTCQVEPGYLCSGTPSTCTLTTCGNGAVNPGERCDDGGLVAGDGCSPWCEVEAGFACSGSPSVCRTLCGDGSLDPQNDSALCTGGSGTCELALSHNQGFGTAAVVRPLQPLRLSVARVHTYPMSFGLAVDYNGNGRRDYGEPIIDNAEERYRDLGADGCASPDEDGQGGCSGGAYDPLQRPDPNGDDYAPEPNFFGTEGNFRWDDGEPFDDDGLDGVPATGDFGEGDGVFSQHPTFTAILEQSPAQRILEMPPSVLERMDWWMDAGLRDFINSAQVSNHLWGALLQRAPGSRDYLGEASMPGYDADEYFWYLRMDYAPEAIGKNAYLRYGDPALCPGFDEEWGLGNHVGSVEEVIARIYLMLSFAAHRLPGGDYRDVAGDLEDLGGPSGSLGDFVFTGTYPSEALGREIPYGIVLPPSYYLDPEARYPVLFFLHGQGDGIEMMLPSGFLFFTAMKESYWQDRTEAGRSDWPKAILVFPDGHCQPEECYTGTFYANFQGKPDGRRFEDALLELFAHLDATYRTRYPAMVER